MHSEKAQFARTARLLSTEVKIINEIQDDKQER